MRDFTSNKIKDIKPSGIRKFFDIALRGCINPGDEVIILEPNYVC